MGSKDRHVIWSSKLSTLSAPGPTAWGPFSNERRNWSIYLRMEETVAGGTAEHRRRRVLHGAPGPREPEGKLHTIMKRMGF